MKETIQFKLNNKSVSLSADTDRKLLWVLRTDFGLVGAKYGCGDGLCGSCTVLVNDVALRSCQLTLKEVQAKKVVTIEGLARTNDLHPLQKAFMEHDALQCGYCTPGMILQAYSLLRRNPRLTPAQLIEGLEGNLCRCGAHTRIVRAVQAAAMEMRGGT
jgi:aerobic-type carbon monoxide dehydrogenase small subunit (CoxS/CutS family)